QGASRRLGYRQRRQNVLRARRGSAPCGCDRHTEIPTRPWSQRRSLHLDWSTKTDRPRRRRQRPGFRSNHSNQAATVDCNDDCDTPRERHMYIRRILACAVLICIGFQTQSQTPVPARRIVIAASTILDGKGGVLKNTRIVVEGSKIVAVDPKAAPIDYDLRGLTVLPGWIDAHAHITWSFGKDGKNAGPGETTQDAAYRAAANAWATLMAGFTTIQSIGSPTDLPLRDAIARGEL